MWLRKALNERVALIFLVWAAWLSAEYLFFGPFSYVRIPENANINLAARLATARDITSHNFGYWAAEYAAGADRLSELMACGLDSLLYLVMPGWLAHGLFMLLQRFIAGYFCFRLMKDECQLGPLPSLYAGLAYTLLSHEVFGGPSDNFTLYDGLAVPGLPLVLWFLGRLDLKRARSFVFALMGGGVFALVGAFPISAFVFPIVLLWFAFVFPRKEISFWLMLAVFCAGWLIGTSPFFWATAVNAVGSHRAGGLRVSRLSNFLLVMMMLRDNALSLALALCALIATRGRERRVRALTTMISASFVFLLLSPVIYRAAHSMLGFVSGFNFDRFYIFVPFLCVSAAALGVASIGKMSVLVDCSDADAPPMRAQTLLAVVAICVVVWQSVQIKQETLWEMKSGSNFAAIFERPDLVRLRAATLQDAPFRVVTTGDQPAYSWAYGLESADGYLSLYPKRYQEYWNAVIAPVLQTTPGLADLVPGNLIQLFTPESTRSPQFGLPAGEPIHFDESYNLNLLSLVNVRYVVSTVPLQTQRLILQASTFRDAQVPWTLASKFGAYVGMLRGAPPGPPLYIYENRDVLPRFILTSHVIVLSSSSKILAAIRAADITALGSTAFIQEGVLPQGENWQVSGNDGAVNLVYYGPDRIELDAKADSAKILVITNSFNRYWKARVDGQAATIFPADHAFQGVIVPKGTHRVILQYEPPYGMRF